MKQANFNQNQNKPTSANFIKSTGDKMLEAEKTKSQGTAKINTYCTASMTVTKTGKTLCVEYCKTHYGHTFQLGHLRMAEKDRKDIAMKLQQGISFYHILNTIRTSVGSKFDRIHLLTKKDISNIRLGYTLLRDIKM